MKENGQDKKTTSKISFFKNTIKEKQWTKLSSTISATDNVEMNGDEEVLIDGISSINRKKKQCFSCSPSLVLALFMTFKGTFLAAAFFKLCADSLAFASPILLR